MKRLAIIGASGHGKVIADIAQLCGDGELMFYDDDLTIKSCGGFPVAGASAEASAFEGDCFVAVGNPATRRRLMEELDAKGKCLAALVHPAAVVAASAQIGAGSVVMAGAVINPDARLGRGVIVNTCASVDHDCVVGDYAHISVGSHLCGTVRVGEGTWVGSGAIVSNNVNVCGNCTIGAGAVVVRDIESSGTYVGVPAKRIK